MRTVHPGAVERLCVAAIAGMTLCCIAAMCIESTRPKVENLIVTCDCQQADFRERKASTWADDRARMRATMARRTP